MSQTKQERAVPVREERTGASSIGTAKGLFFLAAGISLVASVGFYFTGDPQRGIFVGIWVPSILSAGALLMAGHEHG
jgi:hypothetical protein